ncbi:hypothetical protein [Reyranella sp.]|uniref:hypothetical protein n=1 Tax=Reyranella sp. TaxID=1929291 RepID=UPI004036A18D
MPEPLSDLEVQDVLHRMVFDLQSLSGETTDGDFALKTARAALLCLMSALITLTEKPPMPSPPEQH